MGRLACRADVDLVEWSSELRAVQGREACDFKLVPPQPSKPLRQQQARAKKRKRDETQQPPPFDPKQRWRLDRNVDASTRRVCEAT